MWIIIKFIFAVFAIACVISGIVVANQDTPHYDQASYFLLLAIINYLSAIAIDSDK